MPYKKLGKSGLSLSQYALGGWVTFGSQLRDQSDIQKIHRLAYESGINFFDIADVYARGESEIAMGRALSEFPRHELVISSKAYWPMSEDVNDRGLSRKHLMESIHKSLKRIGTEYLDLYFCHRFDPETPLEETIRTMDDLIHQGKIMYWGTSEWSGDQLRECAKICREGGYYQPVVEQPQYSLIARQKFEMDTLLATKELGMGTVTWSPLASGALTGKYDHGLKEGRLSQENLAWLREVIITPQNIERIQKLKPIADELGCSRSQLAIAWVAAQTGVSSVILGASSTQQLQENLGALKVPMTPALSDQLKTLFF